jgi:negative regulator of flagellin synthesis FlgM
MKIEQSIPQGAAQILKEARGPSVKKAPSTSGEVELSRLASLLSASDGAPPFDVARVTEIKQAISEGKFSIDANAIADRLIVSARELIGSQYQS